MEDTGSCDVFMYLLCKANIQVCCTFRTCFLEKTVYESRRLSVLIDSTQNKGTLAALCKLFLPQRVQHNKDHTLYLRTEQPPSNWTRCNGSKK
jgi:hypothetical protein